jgi:CheY-like chemotaxis protein
VTIKQYSVLIANDCPMQLAILKIIFEKCEFVTTVAINGQLAFEKIIEKSKNPDGLYDLVILDLDMPILDGFEACKKIKQFFESQSDRGDYFEDYIPVIMAVSGYISEEIEMKITETGFNGFFQAPLRVQDIQN